MVGERLLVDCDFAIPESQHAHAIHEPNTGPSSPGYKLCLRCTSAQCIWNLDPDPFFVSQTGHTGAIFKQGRFPSTDD
jgi:hypothetical protein